ncbi:hypothetical protein PAECIP112173_00362 [Paenibacillus sp. JJ-100]|uniref:hypothetical protein n=1 Tax=Paenibacillus sp. JJ-100 TaxID=2974896 RepID=UPI0022FF4F28|nr:hypothetical protein [Paenibacillus sp. JJ-100]CAI6023922.1 hypothetical protein PAECIP112173_00362 [Paenibacillus sp. JJ-100]
MELVTFLLFSTLEVLAVFVFMMVFFRENPMDYIWQAVSISVLMGLQSYFLRELELGYVATVINLMFYVLILAAIVRLPLIWAAIISGVGFFSYGIVQALMLAIVGGELLQLISSILFLVISYALYKFGLGFEAPYDLFRLPGEKNVVVSVILVSFVLMTIAMYVQLSWVNIMFFGAASALFIYYAVRKEREDK